MSTWTLVVGGLARLGACTKIGEWLPACVWACPPPEVRRLRRRDASVDGAPGGAIGAHQDTPTGQAGTWLFAPRSAAAGAGA